VTGYTLSSESALFNASLVLYSGESDSTASGTDAGEYPMNLTEDDFSYDNSNINVSFSVTDGSLTINKATMAVTVTGNTDTVTYNGGLQSVTGYTLSSESALFNASLVLYSGESDSTASGTDAGEYPMNLTEDDFSYDNDNIDVEFSVTDGKLVITGCPKILVDADNQTWIEDFEGDAEAQGYVYDPSNPDLWTRVRPYCWDYEMITGATQIDSVPQIYRGFNTTTNGHFSLRMQYKAVVATPELDESVDLGKIRLSLYVRQSYYRYQLQIGVLTADGEFEPVAVVNNPDKTKTYFECGFEAVKDLAGEGRRIAFKNFGSNENDPYAVNYLDDIKLTYVDVENCLLSPDTIITFEGLTTLSGATGVEPTCWEVIPQEEVQVELTSTTKPQLYRGYNSTNGGSYSLRMMNRCVYAMPEFAGDYPIQNITMKLKLRQPNSLYRLQVGVVDEDGFHVVQTLKGGTTMAEKTVSFNRCQYSGRIAFRNTLVPGTGMRTDYLDYSYNYIDDITLSYNAKGKIEASDESVMDAALEDIAVYPNPTTGNLYIDAIGVQKVECYNAMGQLVRVYDNVVNSIDLNNLSEGVYTLRITVPQGVTVRKVVKK
jgi:major membrane immunogen (membrane-anchored lipoprotein)